MTDKQQITILRKALVDVVQKLGEMPGWINIEDRKPEPYIYVLFDSAGSVCEGWFSSESGKELWHVTREPGQPWRGGVSRWMPMPLSSHSTLTLAETLQAICASALGEIEVGE